MKVVCEICGAEGAEVPDDVHEAIMQSVVKDLKDGDFRRVVMCCPDCNRDRRDEVEAYCNARLRPN